jgi:hypothetical protein
VTNNPAITSADVTVNNVAIGGNRTITIGAARTLNANGAVSLGTGQIIGAGLLNLGTAATITHGVGGQVNTTLRKNFAGPSAAFEMPVGTIGEFSPLFVTVTAGSGQLTVTPVAAIQPMLVVNTGQVLERYWTLSGSGITSTITFQYVDADVPAAGEAGWNIIRVTGTVAIRYPPTLPFVTMNPAANQFTISDLSTYSDWTAGAPLAPTAANVGVTGRVLDSAGRGLFGARISMRTAEGQTYWALTNPFGYYRFTGIPSGDTYIVQPEHKRYQFTPRTVTLVDDLNGLDFAPVSDSRPGDQSDRQTPTDRRSP